MKVNLEQSDQAILNVNKIIDKSDLLGLDVIYITNEWKKKSIANIVTGGILGEGNEMAKMDPRIKNINNNHFVKHIMDSFSNKDFEQYLIDNKIDQLYITGLDAEACVDRTVKAAINRGYKVNIVRDAVVTKNEERRNKKINEFKSLGARIIETADLIK
jgi:nicotinamidase-related amidase